MSYPVKFTPRAGKEFDFWQTADRRVFDKLKSLLREIEEHYDTGSGNPEVLKHELSGRWSRRLTQRDRIIYALEDGEIIIYQCRYHY